MARGRNAIVGASGPTIEFTNLKEQMLGIIWPVLIMIFLRGLILMLAIIVILCIGEQASAIVLLVTCFRLWLGSTIGVTERLREVPFTMVICGMLTALAFTDYWPSVLVWTRIENQMHYRLHWDFTHRWLVGLSFDTGLVPVTAGVLWTRAIITVVVPFIIAMPARAADWALWIETIYTNARNLGFKAADPGSIPRTEGFGVKSGSSNEENEGEEKITVVPAPTFEGVEQ